MCTRTHVYAHIYVCVHTYAYIHVCIHTYVYTHIYTYIMSLRVKMYSKCKGPEVGRSLMILSNRKQVGVARTGFLNSRTTDI